MRKKIVVVDICNTLANVNGELARRGYDTSVFPARVPINLFQDYSLFSEAQPINESIFLLRQLATIYSIVYLTARPIESEAVTQLWLERHYCPKSLLFHTMGRPKGEFFRFFKDAGIEVAGVLEDAPHELESIREAQPHVKTFIPRWNYNQHIVGNSIPITGISFERTVMENECSA
jgi:hypothetical protein